MLYPKETEKAHKMLTTCPASVVIGMQEAPCPIGSPGGPQHDLPV